MSIRTVVILLLCILSAVFLAVNWSGIVAPVPVNLLFTQVQAPLGLILFVVLGLLIVACLLWSIMQQAAVLVDIRKAYREARTNKRLAEDAEQSRLEVSTKTVTQEFADLSQAMKTESEKTVAALTALTEEVRTLQTNLKSLDAKMVTIAQSHGIELPPEEPPKRRHPFFDFFSKKADKVEQTEETKPALSAEENEKPREDKTAGLT